MAREEEPVDCRSSRCALEPLGTAAAVRRPRGPKIWLGRKAMAWPNYGGFHARIRLLCGYRFDESDKTW